jgi:hypothetical protein
MPRMAKSVEYWSECAVAWVICPHCGTAVNIDKPLQSQVAVLSKYDEPRQDLNRDCSADQSKRGNKPTESNLSKTDKLKTGS